jgi:hypothetical protein
MKDKKLCDSQAYSATADADIIVLHIDVLAERRRAEALQASHHFTGAVIDNLNQGSVSRFFLSVSDNVKGHKGVHHAEEDRGRREAAAGQYWFVGVVVV